MFWFTVDEFLDYCLSDPVDELIRVMLTSDGSMTRLLKTLFLEQSTFKVNEQEVVLLDKEIADFLEVDAHQPSIWRNIWLGAKGCEKLVNAYCVIPIARLNKDIYTGLKDKHEPLGGLLSKLNLPTLRDKLLLGKVENIYISNIWQTNQPIWVRYYRLSAQDQLKAAILEFLAPKKQGCDIDGCRADPKTKRTML